MLLLNLFNLLLQKIQCLQHFLLFTIRVWIAHVFFVSGLVKIADFNNTIALFQDEYAVPLLPPIFAAISGTFFELVCPVLITIGLATRLATLPLLAMTAVIQFTYDQNIQHAYWAMLLGIILSFGPGVFSLDQLIKKKYGK
jgi:putative oxidoreductase